MKVRGRKIYWAKVKEGAIIPTRRKEDAGWDIYACFNENEMVIPAHETVMVPTGLAYAISDKYYFQVEERGSTGTKGMKKSAGVMDSGYRNEMLIVITNCNDKDIVITKTPDKDYGDAIVYPYTKAICQLVMHRVRKFKEREVSYDHLMNFTSKRGKGRLGSSGK